MPPVYRGPFGKPQAERLLWRAGFGPRPGEAERLARPRLPRAVHSLTHPGRGRGHGPQPPPRRPLADPPGAGAAARPEAARRRRPQPRPLRPLGPRPALVARPDD